MVPCSHRPLSAPCERKETRRSIGSRPDRSVHWLHARRNLTTLVGLFCLLAFPGYARADVGTPLMWAGFLHLFFGNTLIGLLEGLAIAWLFSVSKARAVGIMILANYFSAWVGFFFILGNLDESARCSLGGPDHTLPR